MAAFAVTALFFVLAQLVFAATASLRSYFGGRGVAKVDFGGRGITKVYFGGRGVAKVNFGGRSVAKVVCGGRGVAKVNFGGRGIAKVNFGGRGVAKVNFGGRGFGFGCGRGKVIFFAAATLTLAAEVFCCCSTGLYCGAVCLVVFCGRSVC